ncbi:MAG: putative lipid II flippase FtsW [Alphaproteobacteria bacterium]|nr:putative lipid II flippase FtsW [Alphaproteobacteria bacterium]
MSFLSRTDQSILGQWWWTIDRKLLVCLIFLIAVGVALVTTASPPVAMRIGLDQYHFVLRHLVILVPSFLMMVSLSFLDHRSVWRISSLVFVLSIFALIYTLINGLEIKGARRWISLPGFSLQPSEFIKPAFIVVISWFISKAKSKSESWGVKISLGLYALVVSLLILQPDIGMTFVVTCSLIIVFVLAGLPLRFLFLSAMLGVLALVIAYFSFSHVQSRIDRFLNPGSGDTFQVEKSLEAFRAGGVFGVGPGQGTVKLGLPDVHADFIFSTLAEEFGLIFVLLLIGLYGYIILRGMNRVMDSGNLFVMLSVGGLLGMFGVQALIHMGSALSLLPAKGMTLPFVSYGGSSLLSISYTMGMVLALTRRNRREGIAYKGRSGV